MPHVRNNLSDTGAAAKKRSDFRTEKKIDNFYRTLNFAAALAKKYGIQGPFRRRPASDNSVFGAKTLKNRISRFGPWLDGRSCIHAIIKEY